MKQIQIIGTYLNLTRMTILVLNPTDWQLSGKRAVLRLLPLRALQLRGLGFPVSVWRICNEVVIFNKRDCLQKS